MITDEESKKQERRITGRVCPNCHTQNVPTARYCNSCGLALTEELKTELDIYESILSDPVKMRELLTRLISTSQV